MNKSYKIFFWIFPFIILLNIAASIVYQYTGIWYDLPVAIFSIYIGGPLWGVFFIWSVILLAKKKLNSFDKKLFIVFCVLSLGVLSLYVYDVTKPITTPSLVEQNPDLQDWINFQKINNR